MVRLPNPGSDSGQWGNILNEFLEVSHNTDGTLKPGAGIADGSVTTAKLADGAVTQIKINPSLIEPAAGVAGLRTLGNGANQAMPGNATVTASAHAASHKGGGSDVIDSATSVLAGLMSAGDKVKLDAIEAAADVTDATNVDAAGAVMNTDTSTVAMQFVIDEDNMATNSATRVPTQQSVKAYVDNNVGDVAGPGSATADGIVLFNGTTGKSIKDSTKTLPAGVVVGTTDTQVLSGKTLTTPTISSTGFTNAQHAHTGATSGGQLTDAALSAAVGIAKGGTGRVTSTTAYGLIAAGTTATGVQQTIAPGTTGHILKSNGASALASFQAGAPTDVGLANVNNTSDANKPVSTAQQTALNLKTDLTAFQALALYSYLGMADVPLHDYITSQGNLIVDTGRRLDEVEAEAGPHNWTVAAPTTVVTKAERDAEDLPYWPDSVMSFTEVGADIIGFSTDSRWVVGEDPDPFLDTVSFSYADRPQITAIKDPTDVTYGGGGPVYKDPGSGNLFMIWHGEQDITGSEMPGAFWSFLGIASSTDNGQTWVDMGRIIQPDMSYNVLANNEIGAGAYIIDGGYMYVYFKETIGDNYWTARQLNLSVARCLVTDILAAFAGNTTPVFKKYNNGTWTQNGIGGVASDILYGSVLPRAWDIVYLADRQRFLLAYSHIDELAYGGKFSISVRLGTSPINFEAPERLLGPSTAETLYVTLSSPDHASQKSVTGNQVELFFVNHADQSIPRWDDANLQKTVLTFAPQGDVMAPVELVDADLENSWIVAPDPADPGVTQTLQYYQHKGRAYLHSNSGLTGGAAGDVIFTLPPEYRPSRKYDIKTQTINTGDGGLYIGSIVIEPSGTVTAFYPPTFTYVIATNISWPVHDYS